MRLDERTFEELVVRQRALIWSVCERHGPRGTCEVEDAFQEVVAALWRDLHSYEGRSAESTWVYRVALSTMLNLRRSPSVGAVAIGEADVDCTADSDDDSRYVRELVATMPEKDRLVAAAYLDGFSHSEIGMMTGLSAAAVAVRLHRIKKKMKQLYEKGI